MFKNVAIITYKIFFILKYIIIFLFNLLFFINNLLASLHYDVVGNDYLFLLILCLEV